MKKCQKSLISSLQSKIAFISIILIIGVNKLAAGQMVFKFKELPLKLQNAVLTSVQNRLINMGQDTALNFVDTVTVSDTVNHILNSFNFLVRSYIVHDSTVIKINCIRNNIIIGEGGRSTYSFFIEFTNSTDGGGGWSGNYQKTYTTTAKLSFMCLDSAHMPHHSATTLKEMLKLQAIYHCKKIITLIMDE